MSIDFTNHRKVEDIQFASLISVIKDRIIYNGWIRGRSLEETIEDFGEENKNWFWMQRAA